MSHESRKLAALEGMAYRPIDDHYDLLCDAGLEELVREYVINQTPGWRAFTRLTTYTMIRDGFIPARMVEEYTQ